MISLDQLKRAIADAERDGDVTDSASSVAEVEAPKKKKPTVDRAEILRKAREKKMELNRKRKEEEELKLAEAAKRQEELKRKAMETYERELQEKVKREAKKVAKKIALKKATNAPLSDSDENDSDGGSAPPPPAPTHRKAARNKVEQPLERAPQRPAVQVEQPYAGLKGRQLLRALGL